MSGNNNDTGDPDSGYPSSIPTYSEVQEVVDVAMETGSTVSEAYESQQDAESDMNDGAIPSPYYP